MPHIMKAHIRQSCFLEQFLEPFDTVSISKGGKGGGKERSKESEEYLQMVK